MAIKNALLLLLAICVLAAGCAKPEDKFIGQYTGKLELSGEAKSKLDSAGPMAAQLKAMMENVTLNLDLKKDKTYSVNTTIAGKQANTSGTWSVADNKVTLMPTRGTGQDGKEMAITTGKAMNLAPSDDGKTLTMDETANPQTQAKVVFTRN